MVTTRAMRSRASHAEEKKEDGNGDYVIPSAASPPSKQLPQSTTATAEQTVPQNDHPSSKEVIVAGNRHSNDTREAADASSSPPIKPKKKSPFLLMLCASGITSCYLWYGCIQEKVFHMDNNSTADADDNEADGTSTKGSNIDDNQSITLFLLATGTFSSFLLAWMWTIIGPILLADNKAGSGKGSSKQEQQQQQPTGRLNHPLIIITSATYLSAMAASNESLHYVSYPTCVLAKSAKLIPTLLVGWIVDKIRSCNGGTDKKHTAGNNSGKSSIHTMEWIGAALITIGIVSFQYIQLHKQSTSTTTTGSHHGSSSSEEKADSPYGLALLGFSLVMDGLMAAGQSTMKQKHATTSVTKFRPPTAMETMLYINLYATLILLPLSHYFGQFERGLDIIFSNNQTKSMLLLQLNLSASLGQVFIFLTIHHFSPLTCTTITTTRKFFTILLSVYRFNHVLNLWQWCSIGLVFCGLYLQIVAKLFDGSDESGGTGVSGIEKKKVE